MKRARPLSLAGWRILVVDDNPASRNLTIELLRLWNVSPSQAGDASTALALLLGPNGRPFDAVLVSMEMPGMDGERLGAMTRRRPSCLAPKWCC